MKKFLLLVILIIPFLNVNAQGIGELAAAKPPDIFPDNAIGADIIFSESGFGLGAFYRHQFNQKITGFADFSISEAKDPQEFTYVDYFGNTYTYGKINRAFLLPINLGVQYRLFENDIYDNLRPYINIGIGPAIVLTTPYDREFFNAFHAAKLYPTLGGYIGLGANIGINKKNLLGINIRYYEIHLFNKGIEILQNKLENDLGGFFITLNIGTMY